MRSSSVLLCACVLLLCVSASLARPLEGRRSGGPRPEAKHPHPAHQPQQHAHHPHAPSQPTQGEACSFNGVNGVCASYAACNGTRMAQGCGAGVCCIQQTEWKAGCGKAAIERAMEWVNMQLQYCQSPNGTPDPDSDCSSLCQRTSNPEWDAYRSDCSGLVSWAYGLDAPGRSTYEFAPFKTDITFQLDSPSLLRPGDIINSIPHEHVMIFVEWTSSDMTSALLLEEPGCSAPIPHAKQTLSQVQIFPNGTLTVADNGMNFAPVRFYSNQPTC